MAIIRAEEGREVPAGGDEQAELSVLELNEEFVARHRAELQATRNALRLSGGAFLALALAQFTSQVLASGGGMLSLLSALTAQLESLCFGCFLLHAWHKLRRLMRGYTTHAAADEVRGALAAVGDCLSLFGWVLALETLKTVVRAASARLRR